MSIRIKLNRSFVAGFLLILVFAACRRQEQAAGADSRPNILFVIADDQSFPHASAYGTDWVSTPSFDKVAEKGVLFNNAFVAAPQCSPSRAAILTGLNIWQLEEAGTHSSYFPKKFRVFTDVLAHDGYAVGFTGKAWGPGNWEDMGWPQNPVGKAYNDIRFDSVPGSGLNPNNYAANFEAFLDDNKVNEPFFFWFGAHEPHRSYEYGLGKKYMGDRTPVLPGFLPEHDSIANDLLDYAYEISWFDRQLGVMLDLLEQRGMLENTIVVVTADNGMAFPHAKANMYEYGIHVPLAICGPSIAGGRTEDALVSLTDLAPTFLEVAGAKQLEGIEGRSLASMLYGTGSDTEREHILSGRERHTHARPENLGYPARAIRTRDFLYIRNFQPLRWPVGDPPPGDGNIKPGEQVRPVQQGYEDIDDSPSKRVMMAHRDQWSDAFSRSFDKRAGEELFDLRRDPACLTNVVSDTAYTRILGDLRTTLDDELVKQADPRMTGNGDIFETYPRFGQMRAFKGFRERGKYNRGEE